MSVRQREWTTAKGETKTAWICDYFDAGGKRRLKSFRLKKEALAFAAGATVEVKQGVHVADSASVTIAKACELWLEKAAANKLETSTLRDYARTVRLHIAPYLGALKLTTLTVPRLRAFEDELRAAGRSDFTIRRTVLTLGIAIADGQERGLVARNVVRDVRARRGSGDKRQEKRARGKLKVGVDVPTREDVKALLAVASPRWRPLFLVAVFCGLRASELRGLRWIDVDFDRGAIHVRQRADAFNDIGRPKSETSERTVPVPPVVLNALREWKLACPKGKSGLVFPNSRGNPEALSNILRRGLHPAWIAAGVTQETGELDAAGRPVVAARYTGLHCLRHFFASWCANRKADGGLELPMKVVQERLGHSTIALTMNVYAHMFPSSDDGSELAEASAWFSSTAT